MRERTLVVVRHEGVQRKRVGAILATLEARGLKVVALKFLPAAPAAVLGSAPALARCGLDAASAARAVVVVAVEGDGAIRAARALVGDPAAPAAGSLAARGALGAPVAYASADAAAAAADLAAWLGERSAVEWVDHSEPQLYESAAKPPAAAAAPGGGGGGRGPRGGGGKQAGGGGAAAAAGGPPAGGESAADYLRRHSVESTLDRALNLLVSSMPAEPYEWLAAHFRQQGAPSAAPPACSSSSMAGGPLPPTGRACCTRCLLPLSVSFRLRCALLARCVASPLRPPSQAVESASGVSRSLSQGSLSQRWDD